MQNLRLLFQITGTQYYLTNIIVGIFPSISDHGPYWLEKVSFIITTVSSWPRTKTHFTIIAYSRLIPDGQSLFIMQTGAFSCGLSSFKKPASLCHMSTVPRSCSRATELTTQLSTSHRTHISLLGEAACPGLGKLAGLQAAAHTVDNMQTLSLLYNRR